MISTFLGWPYHYKNSLSFPASQVLTKCVRLMFFWPTRYHQAHFTCHLLTWRLVPGRMLAPGTEKFCHFGCRWLGCSDEGHLSVFRLAVEMFVVESKQLACACVFFQRSSRLEDCWRLGCPLMICSDVHQSQWFRCCGIDSVFISDTSDVGIIRLPQTWNSLQCERSGSWLQDLTRTALASMYEDHPGCMHQLWTMKCQNRSFEHGIRPRNLTLQQKTIDFCQDGVTDKNARAVMEQSSAPKLSPQHWFVDTQAPRISQIQP